MVRQLLVNQYFVLITLLDIDCSLLMKIGLKNMILISNYIRNDWTV